MKKIAIMALVAALCGTFSITSSAQAKGEAEGMFISYSLRQGSFFKINISGQYIIKDGVDIGRDTAERRARIAYEGLRSWGWISQFRGLESSTKYFVIKVDVTATALADGPEIVTETRVYVYKPGGDMVAWRFVDHRDSFTNPGGYQERLAIAVEQAQIEAISEGKEVHTTPSAICPSAGEELGRGLLK